MESRRDSKHEIQGPNGLRSPGSLAPGRVDHGLPGANGREGREKANATAPEVKLSSETCVAILDQHGTVVAGDCGWNRVANGHAAHGTVPGKCGQISELLARLEPGAATVLQDGLDEVLKGKTATFTTELRLCENGNAAQHWYLLSITAIAGGFEGAVLACLEVTQKRQGLKELELFRQLIDHSSDAIFFVEPGTSRILDVNERACLNLGYTREELLRLSMVDVEVAFDDFSWPEQVAKVEAGELEILESGQRRKNGEVFPVEISLKHVEVENRRYIVAAARDITDKKQLEAKFLRAQRLESIGRLAGGIAHDLNNVLGPVTLAMQLLREKVPDAATREILDLIDASTQRGTSMIRQVLTFAQGIKGQRSAVHVRDLINELVKMGRETFPRSIRIETRIQPDLWLVTGDATQLHQVLMNLSVNACDAMPGGGLLEIHAENRWLTEKQARPHPGARPGAFVVLSVRDTGTGIPAEIIDKIFEPFFTTKNFGKGTGLGLSTVLGIAKSHNGFVTIESESGKGSLFEVFLPAKSDPSLLEKKSSGSDNGVIARPNGMHARVLIVDDEEAIRLVTQAVLRAHQYEAITASNGAEAVEIYKEQQKQIDLVIMDIAMPVMDGPTAIRAIRQMNPSARILAVSGWIDNERLAAAAGQEPISLLIKPYSPAQLLDSLAQVLSRQTCANC